MRLLLGMVIISFLNRVFGRGALIIRKKDDYIYLDLAK
jgi:hypothetical protein